MNSEMATGKREAHRAKDPDNGEVENDAGEGRKRVEDDEDEEEEHEEHEEHDDDDDDDEAPEEPSPAEQLEALRKTEAWQAIENYQKQYYPGGLPSHIDVNEVWGYLHKDPDMISNPRKHYFRVAIVTGAKKRAKEDRQWRRDGDETWRQAVRRSRLFCWYRPAAIMALQILDSPGTNCNRIPDFLQSQMEELGLDWFLEEPSSWSPGQFWRGASFDSPSWIFNHVFHFGAKYSRPAINLNPLFRSDYLHPENASSDSANSSPPEPNLAPRPEQTIAETEAAPAVQPAISATSSARCDDVDTPNPQTDVQLTNNEASPTPSTAPKAAPVGILTGSLTASLNTPAVSPVPTQQHGIPGQGGRIHGIREGSKAVGKRKRGHGGEDKDEDEDMRDATRLEKPKRASDASPTPMPPGGDSIQKEVKDLRKRFKNIVSSIREADFAPRKEVSEAAKKTEDGFKATREAIEAIGKRLEVLEKPGASVNKATTAAANSLMRAKTPSTLQKPTDDKAALERRHADRRLATATAQITALTNDLAATNNQITTLATDLESAKSQNTTLTTNLCTTTTQLTGLTTQLESAITAKALADTTTTTLQAELAASKTDYAALLRANTALQSQHTALQSHHTALQSQHTALTNEHNATQARLLDTILQGHSVPELMDAVARRRGGGGGGGGGVTEAGQETPSGGGARIITEATWMSRGGSYGYRAASVALEGGFPFNRGQQQQQQQQGGFVAGEAREEMQRQQRRGREGERWRREVEVLDGEDGR